jgi:tRNA pseudouridine55 synthase
LTGGIVLLDKPPGQTSHQSLGALKRRLATGRIGHTGTLDKFADGLLVVLCGSMTRLCAFATAMDKEYVAVVRFGQTTDTLDPEGTVTAEGPVPSRESIEGALPGFLGRISQVPPAFSAIHVEGRRAYEAAREGKAVEMPPRSVFIGRIDLLDYAPPEATIRVACSKGTYIRALGRDIALSLGTVAHLSRLKRTRVGGFSVEEAVAPQAFDPSVHLLPPAAFFQEGSGIPRIELRPELVDAVAHGARFSPRFLVDEPAVDGTFGAFSPAGDLIAVLERAMGAWRYAAVFPKGEPQ